FSLHDALPISLSIFYNTWVKSFGIVAFLTILSVILISFLPSIFGEKATWLPSKLTEHIHQMLVTGSISTDLINTAAITIIVCGILLISSVFIFKTKELAN